MGSFFDCFVTFAKQMSTKLTFLLFFMSSLFPLKEFGRIYQKLSLTLPVEGTCNSSNCLGAIGGKCCADGSCCIFPARCHPDGCLAELRLNQTDVCRNCPRHCDRSTNMCHFPTDGNQVSCTLTGCPPGKTCDSSSGKCVFPVNRAEVN